MKCQGTSAGLGHPDVGYMRGLRDSTPTFPFGKPRNTWHATETTDVILKWRPNWSPETGIGLLGPSCQYMGGNPPTEGIRYRKRQGAWELTPRETQEHALGLSQALDISGQSG